MKKYMFFLIFFCACKSSVTDFHNCIGKEKSEVLILSIQEFKKKLKESFGSSEDDRNLKTYLNYILNKRSGIMTPSVELQKRLAKVGLIRDIWNEDQSPNINGQFIKCLRQENNVFLNEYGRHIDGVGDTAPSIIASGILEHLEENECDDSVFLVAVVNFYLITLN